MSLEAAALGESGTRPALWAQNISRTFTTGAGDVHACTDISIQTHAGELLVVRGKSGSGKTTLLNILGGLDRPTSGKVWIGGQDLTTLNDAKLAAVRRGRIGYVFQTFGLIPVLSAAENVEVPLRIRGTETSEREAMVTEMLELVGLGDHAAQRPYELSGGQQQRVGLARALIGGPDILLADEPTGQLDSRTAATMMDLIEEVVKAKGIAAIVSTHDPLLVARAHNVVDLHDGRLVQPATHEGRHVGQPMTD